MIQHMPEGAKVGELVIGGEVSFPVIGVEKEGGTDLLEVAGAGGGAGFLSRGGEDREQQSRKKGDDGDDHQQLDEGKSLFQPGLHLGPCEPEKIGVTFNVKQMRPE